MSKNLWTIAIVCKYISSSRLFNSKSSSRSVIFNDGVSFQMPPPNYILRNGKTGLHSDTMWHNWEYIPWNIKEMSISGIGYLLFVPPVGDIRYPKCTATIHLSVWYSLQFRQPCPQFMHGSCGKFQWSLGAIGKCTAGFLCSGVVSATSFGVEYSSSSLNTSYRPKQDWPDLEAFVAGKRLLVSCVSHLMPDNYLCIYFLQTSETPHGIVWYKKSCPQE